MWSPVLLSWSVSIQPLCLTQQRRDIIKFKCEHGKELSWQYTLASHKQCACSLSSDPVTHRRPAPPSHSDTLPLLSLISDLWVVLLHLLFLPYSNDRFRVQILTSSSSLPAPIIGWPSINDMTYYCLLLLLVLTTCWQLLS